MVVSGATAAFLREAAIGSELWEFGVCAALLEESQTGNEMGFRDSCADGAAASTGRQEDGFRRTAQRDGQPACVQTADLAEELQAGPVGNRLERLAEHAAESVHAREPSSHGGIEAATPQHPLLGAVVFLVAYHAIRRHCVTPTPRLDGALAHRRHGPAPSEQ